MVRREVLAVLKASNKGAKSPKLERPRPPKLVCVHFKSTSTYMNFFSRFYFLTPMDYIVHGPKGNFGCFDSKQKMGKFFETGEVTLTKLGAHVHLMAFMTSATLNWQLTQN